jgi:uncharacterized protein (TIGR02246 family)
MSKSLLILAVCASLTACATTPPAAPDVERQVAQASDEFLASRQSGDASSFVSHFTDDGSFMVPGLPDVTGHSAIQALAQKRFAGGRTDDFTVRRREIQVQGDAAHELAWFSEIDRRQEQAFRMEGRHFILWKRGSDGRWRVHRYLYNFADARPVA